MRTKLDSFLNPKTIAIIGASNNPMKVGGILMKKLDKFKGKIIPVNKKEFQIRNKLVYKKIIDYPGKIDLAVIATPRKAVKKTV